MVRPGAAGAPARAGGVGVGTAACRAAACFDALDCTAAVPGFGWALTGLGAGGSGGGGALMPRWAESFCVVSVDAERTAPASDGSAAPILPSCTRRTAAG